MTMPDERTRAVVNTHKFLRDLLDPKATPKVPKHIREKARRLLKHYPSAFHLLRAAEQDKDIFDVVEARQQVDQLSQAFAKAYSKGRIKI